MELTVNGEQFAAQPRDDESLLELLRDELGLRSMKDGCAPEGSCGACTVIVRRPRRRLVRAEGDTDRGQERRHAGGADRGGAAALGRLLRRGRRLAVRLLLAGDRDEGRGAAREEARADARRDREGPARQPLPLHRLREDRRRDRAASPPPSAASRCPSSTTSGRVGSRTARYRGAELALGDQPYIDDMVRAGDAPRRAVLSEHPRARVRRDRHLEGRRRYPGVRRGRRPRPTCPAQRSRARSRPTGGSSSPWARRRAYVGDVLAAVAAETRHAAREAAALDRGRVRGARAGHRPVEALAPARRSCIPRATCSRVARAARRRRGGARRRGARRHRDLPDAVHRARLPRARVVRSRCPGASNGRAPRSCTSTRRARASTTTTARSRVPRRSRGQRPRHAGHHGGAFGGKEDLNVQARRRCSRSTTGRPVQADALAPREPSASTPSATRSWHRATRSAATRTACSSPSRRGSSATRARTPASATRCSSARRATPAAPTRCRNVDIEALAVYTNNPPCGAMRGFGANQSDFAMEGCLDMLAEKVGHRRLGDPLAQRARGRATASAGPEARTGVGLKKTLARGQATPTTPRAPAGGRASPAASRTPASATACRSIGRALLRPSRPTARSRSYHTLDRDGPGASTRCWRRSRARSSGSTPSRFRATVDTERRAVQRA